MSSLSDTEWEDVHSCMPTIVVFKYRGYPSSSWLPCQSAPYNKLRDNMSSTNQWGHTNELFCLPSAARCIFSAPAWEFGSGYLQGWQKTIGKLKLHILSGRLERRMLIIAEDLMQLGIDDPTQWKQLTWDCGGWWNLGMVSNLHWGRQRQEWELVSEQ